MTKQKTSCEKSNKEILSQLKELKQGQDTILINLIEFYKNISLWELIKNLFRIKK